ncbi:granzyme H isoform X2 [Oryctolagus cuniculus]|uniref:granzyme H isoform X2 n=1 Tax=Oryctolagus cuniculus TaxID=9986 RepID=UPI0007EE85A9
MVSFSPKPETFDKPLCLMTPIKTKKDQPRRSVQSVSPPSLPPLPGLCVWEEETPAAPTRAALPGRCCGSCSCRSRFCLLGQGQFLAQSKKRCSGVLVREDFVLTAAHCLGSSINVTLGAHNIKEQERTQQVIPVRRAIPHKDYNPEDYTNDIMLLQLERKAKKTKAVRPIRLPRGKARVKPGQVCRVAGWGQVASGTLATTLQEVELTVQQDQECESLFRGYYSRATEICVGDPKKMKTGGKGDSGGPLVCSNVAQGILSYGQRNRTPPGVFIKVSSFLPWIKRIMKGL